jgi:regulator of sigma E protease
VLIYAISLLATLSILILVHEFGHFFAAKAVGIQVPRFSLGFGKRLAGFHWGETEFVVSAIPLGGYVKMAGMEDDEAASTLEGAAPPPEEVDPERTFDAKPIWARTLVITAGVIMNLVFAFVVYTGLALVLGETLHPITRVSVPPASQLTGAARALAVVPDGATVTAVGSRPVRTWEDLLLALATAPAGPVRLTFRDHAPVSLLLPPDDQARAEVITRIGPYDSPVLADIVSRSAAARAGLRPGDRVVQAAGAPIATWAQLVEAIRSHPGKPLPLVVERAGGRVALTVTPTAKRDRDAAGNRVTIGQIGARPAGIPEVHRRVGPAESLRLGVQQTAGAAGEIAKYLKKLFIGEVSPRQLGGLLSIGQASGETAQLGFDVWLGFLAFFSVNLAVLNLLPIPILDGGHLLFLAFEAVRGRPLSVEARIRLSQVGLVIVVALMIWANGNDVVRLVFGR